MMENLIKLEIIKQHLNIDAEYNGDDALLANYRDTAIAQVVADTGCDLAELTADGELNPIARHAVLLLMGDFYAYREDTFNGSLTRQPQGYSRLINILRHYD